MNYNELYERLLHFQHRYNNHLNERHSSQLNESYIEWIEKNIEEIKARINTLKAIEVLKKVS